MSVYAQASPSYHANAYGNGSVPARRTFAMQASRTPKLPESDQQHLLSKVKSQLHLLGQDAFTLQSENPCMPKKLGCVPSRKPFASLIENIANEANQIPQGFQDKGLVKKLRDVASSAATSEQLLQNANQLQLLPTMQGSRRDRGTTTTLSKPAVIWQPPAGKENSAPVEQMKPANVACDVASDGFVGKSKQIRSMHQPSAFLSSVPSAPPLSARRNLREIDDAPSGKHVLSDPSSRSIDATGSTMLPSPLSGQSTDQTCSAQSSPCSVAQTPGATTTSKACDAAATSLGAIVSATARCQAGHLPECNAKVTQSIPPMHHETPSDSTGVAAQFVVAPPAQIVDVPPAYITPSPTPGVASDNGPAGISPQAPLILSEAASKSSIGSATPSGQPAHQVGDSLECVSASRLSPRLDTPKSWAHLAVDLDMKNTTDTFMQHPEAPAVMVRRTVELEMARHMNVAPAAHEREAQLISGGKLPFTRSGSEPPSRNRQEFIGPFTLGTGLPDCASRTVAKTGPPVSMPPRSGSAEPALRQRANDSTFSSFSFQVSRRFSHPGDMSCSSLRSSWVDRSLYVSAADSVDETGKGSVKERAWSTTLRDSVIVRPGGKRESSAEPSLRQPPFLTGASVSWGGRHVDAQHAYKAESTSSSRQVSRERSSRSCSVDRRRLAYAGVQMPAESLWRTASSQWRVSSHEVASEWAVSLCAAKKAGDEREKGSRSPTPRNSPRLSSRLTRTPNTSFSGLADHMAGLLRRADTAEADVTAAPGAVGGLAASSLSSLPATVEASQTPISNGVNRGRSGFDELNEQPRRPAARQQVEGSRRKCYAAWGGA